MNNIELKIAELHRHTEYLESLPRCAITGVLLKDGGTEYRGEMISRQKYREIVSYEHEKNARIDRLESRAEKTESQAKSLIRESIAMIEMIPMGQPILVGHHSEKRHRRHLEKSDNKMRKGNELLRKASYQQRRAESAKRDDVIRTEDPAAVIKLRDEIASLESLQERMKSENKIIRAIIKKYETREAQEAALKNEHPRISIALLEPDFCGRIGHADYLLKNNNANIRSKKQRLAELEARQEVLNSGDVVTEEKHGDIRLERNIEDNRLRLYFPGKPSDEIRKALKARGFRWSPSNGAWQAFLNNGSEFKAEQIIKMVNGEN